MEIISSSPIEIAEFVPNNVYYRMNQGQKLSLHKQIRHKACHASWHAESPEYLLQRYFTFILVSQYHHGRSNKILDTDAFSWVVKPFIDGAVDGRVIIDDTPQYIHSVVILPPERNEYLPAGVECSFTGLFTEPIFDLEEVE